MHQHQQGLQPSTATAGPHGDAPPGQSAGHGEPSPGPHEFTLRLSYRGQQHELRLPGPDPTLAELGAAVQVGRVPGRGRGWQGLSLLVLGNELGASASFTYTWVVWSHVACP